MAQVITAENPLLNTCQQVRSAFERNTSFHDSNLVFFHITSLKTKNCVCVYTCVMKIYISDNISAALAFLYWCPVRSVIEFKIIPLTFKAIKALVSSYLIKNSSIPTHPHIISALTLQAYCGFSSFQKQTGRLHLSFIYQTFFNHGEKSLSRMP